MTVTIALLCLLSIAFAQDTSTLICKCCHSICLCNWRSIVRIV